MPQETTPSLPAPNKPSGYRLAGHETKMGNELAPLAVPVPESGRATSHRFATCPVPSWAGAYRPSMVSVGAASVASTLTAQDVTLGSNTPIRNVPPSTSIMLEAPDENERLPSGVFAPSTNNWISPLSRWISQ